MCGRNVNLLSRVIPSVLTESENGTAVHSLAVDTLNVIIMALWKSPVQIRFAEVEF